MLEGAALRVPVPSDPTAPAAAGASFASFSRNRRGSMACSLQGVMRQPAEHWAALFVDFVVLKKQGAHEVGVKEALTWSLAAHKR